MSAFGRRCAWEADTASLVLLVGFDTAVQAPLFDREGVAITIAGADRAYILNRPIYADLRQGRTVIADIGTDFVQVSLAPDASHDAGEADVTIATEIVEHVRSGR